jgi:hypothetical protein
VHGVHRLRRVASAKASKIGPWPPDAAEVEGPRNAACASPVRQRRSGRSSGRRGACRARARGGGVATTEDEPQASRRGWLKNENPPGDLSKALRCGARTRRHTACRGPAMANGRCRMHGGLSTGPKTAAGLERSRRARWKHGAYSRETRAILAESRRRWRELLALLDRD